MAISKFIKKMMLARQINFEEGRFEMLGIRGVILPAFTFTKVIEGMYADAGDDVFDILFEAGRAHGRLNIKEIGEKHGMTKKNYFSEILASGDVMGLGKAELEYFSLDKGKLIIEQHDSPFKEQFNASEVLQDIDRPVDDLLRGIFHEMAANVFGQEVESVEEQCIFQGDPVCRFKITVKD